MRHVPPRANENVLRLLWLFTTPFFYTWYLINRFFVAIVDSRKKFNVVQVKFRAFNGRERAMYRSFNGQGRVKKALRAKLEINSAKVHRIIMHTRCLYYPLTPFSLRRRVVRNKVVQERKKERYTCMRMLHHNCAKLRLSYASDVCMTFLSRNRPIVFL